MQLMQFLGFEVTTACNRGAEHAACPNRHPDRWKYCSSLEPMTNNQIVSVAETVYAGGFTGVVTFHYYNEPLMDWWRIRILTSRIRESVPQAKFLLWTNGDFLPTIPAHEIAGVFTTIVITNYAKRDLAFVSEFCDDVRTVGPDLDWRLHPPVTSPDNAVRCLRPHLEMVFDYCGNVRTCCNDWQGETSIGNIHDTPFEELWDRWKRLREAVAQTPMGEASPLRCLTCGTRYPNMSPFVPDAAQRTMQHLEENR